MTYEKTELAELLMNIKSEFEGLQNTWTIQGTFKIDDCNILLRIKDNIFISSTGLNAMLKLARKNSMSYMISKGSFLFYFR